MSPGGDAFREFADANSLRRSEEKSAKDALKGLWQIFFCIGAFGENSMASSEEFYKNRHSFCKNRQLGCFLQKNNIKMG